MSSYRDALRVAIETAEQAEEAWETADSADEATTRAAWDDARNAVRAARESLRASAEPREWKLCEDGYVYDTVEATSIEEALEIAEANVDRANYSDAESTLYIDVRVRCEETDEQDSSTVTLAPEEPDCTHDDGHDWQSPIELVGGIRENPGVWGHGGGVISHEACLRCGCKRTTDTWATRPDTGEQGLEDVSYEEGAYDVACSVTLTAYNMGADASEEDFDSFAAYVAAHIDEATGRCVDVDQFRFVGGPGKDAIKAPTSDIEDTIRESLRTLWDGWCSSGSVEAAS